VNASLRSKTMAYSREICYRVWKSGFVADRVAANDCKTEAGVVGQQR
jgi:hypothetical protein